MNLIRRLSDWLYSDELKFVLAFLLCMGAGYLGGWLSMEMAGACS
jgi:hypothetical protein